MCGPDRHTNTFYSKLKLCPRREKVGGDNTIVGNRKSFPDGNFPCQKFFLTLAA